MNSRQRRILAIGLLLLLVAGIGFGIAGAINAIHESRETIRFAERRLALLDQAQNRPQPALDPEVARLVHRSKGAGAPAVLAEHVQRIAAKLELEDLTLSEAVPFETGTAISSLEIELGGTADQLINFIEAIEGARPLLRFSAWRIEAGETGWRLRARIEGVVL